MEIQNTFIYLIGFAGTGKLTIATELKKLMPAILVDNHLINNVVFSMIEPDGVNPLPPKIWDYTWKVRDVVLDTIKRLSPPDKNFIFTNQLIEGDEIDAELFSEIVDLAKSRDARLLTVRLLISVDELCRRIASPGRKSKMKMTDALAIREKATSSEVLKPNYPYFDLNVTTLSAEESASVILKELFKN